MNFKCHICGKTCDPKVFYLVSMSETDVDRPFVACGDECADMVDAGHYVGVMIVETGT